MEYKLEADDSQPRTQPVRVLLVDDHPMIREGLRAILKRDPGFEVVAEAGSGIECLELTMLHDPDAVLMDITLPDMSGLDLTRRLRDTSPDIKILMVSMHTKMEYVAQAFQAGAAGYVVKGSSGRSILDGLHAVMKGEQYLDSALSPQVVKRLLQDIQPAALNAGYSEEFTGREAEVLTLLAEGRTTKEAADILCISPKTVEGHRAKIMKKFRLNTPVDLVRFAVRCGLIDLES